MDNIRQKLAQKNKHVVKVELFFIRQAYTIRNISAFRLTISSLDPVNLWRIAAYTFGDSPATPL
jgi:hypothetical protein